MKHASQSHVAPANPRVRVACLVGLTAFVGAWPSMSQAQEPAPAPISPAPASTAVESGKASQEASLPHASEPSEEHETNCADGIDEDHDTVTDCADADCAKDPACTKDASAEDTPKACSDFVDNDHDGSADCDDADCAAFKDVCSGSWRKNDSRAGGHTGADEAPEGVSLNEGLDRIQALLGKGSDADGERSDEVCADGIDNDGDGKIDCEDLGCRFDPEVSVCRDTPDLRFSIYGDVSQSREFVAKAWDTSFHVLQARVFGPLPFLQDSFFLLSTRLEKTPRLTFAFFTMPVYGDHRLTISSGGARLSAGPILSVRKNVLIDTPHYLYSAFEQGNGAAAEMAGPIVPGVLTYRVVGAGGSGQYAGNVGGRYFVSDDRNYTWAAGGQIQYFPFGHFDEDTSRYLYQPANLALSLYLGGKYEQRAAERFPAANAHVLFRWDIFTAMAEAYAKRELEFKSWQFSYNVTAGVLLIPKWLLLVGDIGQFKAGNFDTLPATIDATTSSELKRIRDEFEWRVGLHIYVWRTNGIITLLYDDRLVDGQTVSSGTSTIVLGTQEETHTRTGRIDFQFSF